MPPPMQLDAPPTQPPEVAGQMGPPKPGAPPFAGVGQGLAAQTPEPSGNGATVAATQAVEKVLNNIAKMSPPMAPFVSRMLSIMKAGLEQLAGGGQGTGAAGAGGEAPSPAGPASAKPPEGGKPFPG